MKTNTNHISSAVATFRQHKELAEKAMHQLETEQLFWKPGPDSNSIYIIMKHLWGNMKSRWTNFFTEDGEKPWRDRDSEFEEGVLPERETLMQNWNEGWQCLFDALTPLGNDDLERIVKIRHEEHSVLEAINRQIAHYSYHVGQMVYIAHLIRSDKWESLSIPKGKSTQFNSEKMK